MSNNESSKIESPKYFVLPLNLGSYLVQPLYVHFRYMSISIQTFDFDRETPDFSDWRLFRFTV